MNIPETPNWVRMCVFSLYFSGSHALLLLRLTYHAVARCSFLLILSFVLFLPQLYRIWLGKDCSGISSYYVLLNLLSATEQFTMMFYYLVNSPDGTARNDGRPYNTGDWLNLG
jgi:hypothetical protein